MTERFELDDEDEWIEINNSTMQSVQKEAIESNERFGDALADYLHEALTDDETDESDE